MRSRQCLYPNISLNSGWFYNLSIPTDFDSAKSDHGAVDFVDGAIDLLQIIGVRDDLVAGDDVLC